MHTSSKRHQSSFMAYSHQEGALERRLNGALVFVTMQLSSLNRLLKLHVSTLNWSNVQVVVSTGHQVSGRFNGINKHAGSHANLLKLLTIQSNLVEFENVDLPQCNASDSSSFQRATTGRRIYSGHSREFPNVWFNAPAVRWTPLTALNEPLFWAFHSAIAINQRRCVFFLNPIPHLWTMKRRARSAITPGNWVPRRLLLTVASWMFCRAVMKPFFQV